MSNLTISLNEFRALLRKAFEGVYRHDKDWNALADLVLWLEYRGLNGLQVFIDAEASLDVADRPILERQPNGEVIVKGRGMSLLGCSLEIGDLLIAEAVQSGSCVMQVKDMLDPEFLAATVSRCADNGLAGAAWWPGENNWGMIAFQEEIDTQPNLYRVKLPLGYENYSDITLIADKSLENIQNKYPSWFSFLKLGQRPASEIDNLYLRHLDNGYQISEGNYKRLCHIADRVLVEATEQSRRGAGE